MTPNLPTFLKLARQGNLVPVWKPMIADTLTPVSAYLRLSRGGKARHAFLLESIEGGERIARYSFLGVDPGLIVRAWAGDERLELQEGRRITARRGQALDTLREITARYRPVHVPEAPPFTAGAVGFIGYDLVGQFERVPRPKTAGATPLPDATLMFFSRLLAFDHLKRQILIVANVEVPAGLSRAELERRYRAAERDLARTERLLARPVSLPRRRRPAAPVRWKANMTRHAYEDSVRRGKEYIAAGDVFQVVLSLRLEARLQPEPFAVYRALRTINPSPYMFFLKMDDDTVLGASPEMLVKVTGRDIEYRPIAGTRRRGSNEQEDHALEQDMLADEKERAEHIMLVDLGRNDVGRIAEYGSVSVPGLMFVERYSHVMHLVSDVRGRLRQGLDMFDALASCFPAGTLSGAPKVRAMEIIHELEPTRRGIYGGSVLYLDYSGHLNSCIAIRTMAVCGRRACVQVGAGIVADSDPAREYEECMNKSRALRRAVDMAGEL
jgi:anthranilate synthase component 1